MLTMIKKLIAIAALFAFGAAASAQTFDRYGEATQTVQAADCVYALGTMNLNNAKIGDSFYIHITNHSSIDVIVWIDAGYSSCFVDDFSSDINHSVEAIGRLDELEVNLLNVPGGSYEVTFWGPGVTATSLTAFGI